MVRFEMGRWSACIVLLIAMAHMAVAKPPPPGTFSPGAAPPSPGTMTPPAAGGSMTTPGGSTTGSGATGGFSLLGIPLLSSEQDAMLIATAVAAVQELTQVVPLSTEDQLLLVVVLYELEKWNALAGLIFGGLGGSSTTPTGP